MRDSIVPILDPQQRWSLFTPITKINSFTIICQHHPGTTRLGGLACIALLKVQHGTFSPKHYDVIKWKHFLRYWAFVRESIGHRWIPIQRPVTQSFDAFFDLRLNNRLSKQSSRRFETPSRSSWCHCNEMTDSSVMMTSSNGNIFRVTGHLCGEFTGPGELPAQRPVTRSFDVFFDLSLNKRLSKQSRGWWFETQSRPLWRLCNGDKETNGFPSYWYVSKIVCFMIVMWHLCYVIWFMSTRAVTFAPDWWLLKAWCIFGARRSTSIVMPVCVHAIYPKVITCLYNSNTVRSRYMSVIFLSVTHERHPIALP